MPVDPILVAQNGIKGVVISQVRARTPAATAGLKALARRTGELGDVITVFSLQKTLLETVKPLPVKKPSLVNKIKYVLNKSL